MFNCKTKATTGQTQVSDLDVVIFGHAPYLTAAVMVSLIPAIEGVEAVSHEQALRKLLNATSELLAQYVPKVGAHQRVIHGGGVFDDDLISEDIKEAQRRAL